MATFNSPTAQYCLLILASVVLLSTAFTRPVHQRFRQSPLLRLQSTASPHKSPESNFWVAVTQKNATSSSDRIPAVPQLDRETGRLPPGAYRNIDSDGGEDVTSQCLIAIGIQPPSNANDGKEAWREGVKNCQNLIDAGFDTFRVNDCYEMKVNENSKRYGKNIRKARRRSPSSIALEHMKQSTLRTQTRHQAEANFYRTLRQSTPSSILRTCHFMVNLEIPSVLSEESVIPGADQETTPVSFGNGWMVRECVTNALLRTKGECLDSVVLEYRKNSPYHLDILDTLSEMKREGLIHSISTKNFPPSMVQSALACGFNVYSNEVCGNMMNTNNLQSDGDMGVLCKEHDCSRLVSAPLGGGLFTNQYCQYQDWAQLSSSRKKMFNTLFDSCCKMPAGAELDSVQKWKRYRNIMDALVDIAFKYQASVESIALRWLLQLIDGDSISVGTQLGMDFVEEQGGEPYSRHRNFRQVFTFSLEEDDMERLCKVSGFTSERHLQSGMTDDHEINFTNRALWI